MMNATEATAAHNALSYPVGKSDEAKAVRADYHKQVSEISGQFRDWLADTYASHMPIPVQHLIWGKAWENGHSSGYHEVENHYADFADFAETVRSFQ